MIFDKILSFLFGTKKSNFQISQKEIDAINYGFDLNELIIVIDKNQKPVLNSSPKDFFKLILREINLNSDQGIKQKLSELDSYKYLTLQTPSYKKSILYWLIETIYKTQNTEENNYEKELIKLLIQVDLAFTEKDFIHFINYWKDHYYSHFPIYSLSIALDKQVKKEGISEDLRQFLTSTLTKSGKHKKFAGFKKFQQIVKKIIHQ